MNVRTAQEEKIALRPALGHVAALAACVLIIFSNGFLGRGTATHRGEWAAAALLLVLAPFAFAPLRTVTVSEQGLKIRRVGHRVTVTWDDLASVTVPRRNAPLSARRVRTLVFTARGGRRWTIDLGSVRLADRECLIRAIEDRARPGVVKWDAEMERVINGMWT